jgi:hypothetical protein
VLLLPRVPLSPNFRELGRADSRRHPPECSTGFDRLQLLGISDQDDFRTRLQHARELARADQPGLIDDEYITLTEQLVPLVPIPFPARQRARCDPAGLLQALRGDSGERRSPD